MTWQEIGIIVGLAITVVTAVYGVYAFITRKSYKKGIKDANMSQLEKKINGLPCKVEGDYLRNRDQAYTKIDSIDISLSETSNSITVIKNWIIGMEGEMVNKLYPSVAPKGSPRELNWLGDKIMELVGGIDFLQQHKEYFFDLMDKETPKTAYDVEKSAYSVCFLSSGKEMFYSIKNILFNAPAIKAKNIEGKEVDFIVDIFNVCTVISIPLRDMYLEKHPEIPKDIDNK